MNVPSGRLVRTEQPRRVALNILTAGAPVRLVVLNVPAGRLVKLEQPYKV